VSEQTQHPRATPAMEDTTMMLEWNDSGHLKRLIPGVRSNVRSIDSGPGSRV
jgi:hypothetical protein